MNDFLDAILTYIQRVRNYNPLVVGIQLVLIGAVVWAVLRFLRGTRGARLLKGAALLLAALYIVIRLLPESQEWKRIEFLYANFLILAFVAVVVAFQPELRRVLIRIGQARLFGRARREVEDLVNALVDSASYLSRNKIGAVIGIERLVGLGGLVQTGTSLEAEVSAGLLNTIFYPGSALHDMGVIISNGRLAAAGCQFPLAESADVDASMGSRHRAALGLAQDSDAVVLVVSEETGRISLACEGQLYLGLEESNLRETLLSLLAPASAKRRQKAKAAETE
jgi:diadenylate cyclase